MAGLSLSERFVTGCNGFLAGEEKIGSCLLPTGCSPRKANQSGLVTGAVEEKEDDGCPC